MSWRDNITYQEQSKDDEKKNRTGGWRDNITYSTESSSPSTGNNWKDRITYGSEPKETSDSETEDELPEVERGGLTCGSFSGQAKRSTFKMLFCRS